MILKDGSVHINEQMNRFRLASRSTFNQYFYPTSYGEKGFSLAAFERFEAVEQALFNSLVIKPCQLTPVRYGTDVINEIGVCVSSSGQVPVMINREVDSGYWDHPVREITSDTKMSFIGYFDFDHTRPMDHRYARVVIVATQPDSEILGKHALIETQYIEFTVEG